MRKLIYRIVLSALFGFGILVTTTYAATKQTDPLRANETRVSNINSSLINEPVTRNNLELLTSTKAISKEEIELCGLKGSIVVKDNKYYITYTNDESIELEMVSLIQDIDETKYSITRTDVFEEMSDTTNILTTFYYNDKIHVIGQFEDWYKVDLGNNTYGYIKNEHLANHRLQLKRENGITRIYENDEIVGEDLTKIEAGSFRVTAYCNCSICCGIYAGKGTTASGTHTTENRTVAVDPTVIPLGTQLEFNDNVFTAEDTGNLVKENHVDVFVEGHDNAWHYSGAGYRYVSILVN